MRGNNKQVFVGYLTPEENLRRIQVQEAYYEKEMPIGCKNQNKPFFLGLVEMYAKKNNL